MSSGRNVETLKQRGRAGKRVVTERIDKVTWSITKMRELPDRIKQLELEVQETQRLHQRVAELTDVVAEVLIPAADRDDDRIREVLAKYNATSF